MIIGKVAGTVVSTRKYKSLTGSKFLIVDITGEGGAVSQIVAVDGVGAGIGETVLIATGSSARHAYGADKPVDALIVGIID